MKIKRAFILSLLCTISWQDPKAQTSERTVEERLLELEQHRREYEQWYSEFYIQSQGRVSPFFSERFFLGGYYETAVTHLSGDDMATQTSANYNVVGLNIAADLNESLRFVTQMLTGLTFRLQNPHNNPSLTPPQRQYDTLVFGSVVAQAFVEFQRSELSAVQVGLGYVPFGHAFGQREPVLFKRRGGPQMLTASDEESVGIASPLWMGINLEGANRIESGRIGYNLYTFSPPVKSNTLGVGTRFWWSDSHTTTLGLSVQAGEEAQNSYVSHGIDVNIMRGNFGVVAEYARNQRPNGLPSVVSHYIEPYYSIDHGKWVGYLVADYFQHPTHIASGVANPYEKLLLGGGVNWLPVPNIRLRLGVLYHDYLEDTDTIGGQGRDYTNIDFSAGIAF